MIRLACLLGLVALAMLLMLALRMDGASAIAFSFVGFPALGVAMAAYGLHRWHGRARVSFRKERLPSDPMM